MVPWRSVSWDLGMLRFVYDICQYSEGTKSGANSPHTHPRATEIQIVVQGGPVYTEFIMENGARTVKNTVHRGSATIFPWVPPFFTTSLLSEQSYYFSGRDLSISNRIWVRYLLINLEPPLIAPAACDPTVFVASFDHVDPGTSQIAQNFFALDEAVVDATLGEIGVSVLDHLELPANFILGAQECLDRCNIDRSTFNFSWADSIHLLTHCVLNLILPSATFKDYAIFSNSTWGAETALPASVSSMYGAPSGTAAAKSAVALLADGSTASGTVDIPFAQNPLRPAVIGLGATAAVLLLAVISLSAVMACRRSSGVKASSRLHDQTSSLDGGRYSNINVLPYDDSEAFPSGRSKAW